MEPGARLARGAWLALLAWQWVWHAGWPPAGWAWALAASLPLLLPLRGILTLRHRAMAWGGYLAVAYFIFAVTEAWSDPNARWPAGVQIALTCVFLAGLGLGGRRRA